MSNSMITYTFSQFLGNAVLPYDFVKLHSNKDTIFCHIASFFTLKREAVPMGKGSLNFDSKG